MTSVKPYSENGEKREQVATMFNNIAPTYDALNTFFSLGIDKWWRKKAIRILQREKPANILDVATGTAEFAIETAKLIPDINKITGVDISEGMLEVGRKKVTTQDLADVIELRCADSEQLPFATASFDSFTVAFGVRNFQHLEKGLEEMLRVLKPNGLGVIVEFSKPCQFPIKQLFRFYFTRIIPLIGRMVSKDARAYSYLPESVDAFPSGNEFLEKMNKVGYRDTRCISLTGGIASIYLGRK